MSQSSVQLLPVQLHVACGNPPPIVPMQPPGSAEHMPGGGGVAAVQLAGDMEIVRLALDDVAEYTGPADEAEDD